LIAAADLPTIGPMRIGLILLLLPLASCAAIPVYDDPKRVGRIERLREARDLCLVKNVQAFDDGTSAASKIGNYVAMSCTVETGKLVELAIPRPDQHARSAFQEEAVRRATGYVLTTRRMEADALERHRQPESILPPQ
jgi:hypothetical protein